MVFLAGSATEKKIAETGETTVTVTETATVTMTIAGPAAEATLDNKHPGTVAAVPILYTSRMVLCKRETTVVRIIGSGEDESSCSAGQ